MTAFNPLAERENSPYGEVLRLAAAVLIGAGVSLAGMSAEAAPAPSTGRQVAKSAPAKSEVAKSDKEKVAALSVKDPTTTSSIGAAQPEDANCARARQRLFVEGEGWIVRRVTTCY